MLLGIVAVLLAAAAWVVLRGLVARHDLAAAQTQLGQLRVDLVGGDVPAARADLAALQRNTGRARSLTGDPVWRVLGWVPYAGRSLRATTGMTAAVDDLTRSTLPQLVSVAGALNPRQLRVGGDRVQLAPFTRASPTLDAAANGAAAVRDRVRQLPGSLLLPPVAHARQQLLHQLDTLAGSTDTAARAARLLPPMLGADGPRTYFLAFQTNAEARGAGGLMGAYGLVRADHGTITLLHTGSDQELKSIPKPVISLGKEYDERYAPFSSEWLWVNGNSSPNFPDAAEIWRALWQRQSGQTVDGVIALDPVAMSRILAATGPATLPNGTAVTTQNAVQLTESTAYAAFGDVGIRKEFFQTVAHAVFDRVTAGAGSPKALVTQLGAAAGGGHLQLWSAHPDEQRVLAPLPIAHVLPNGPVPYVQLAVQNIAGSKLDYYLRRSVRYTAGACDGRTRTSTVTVTLTNTAPDHGLADYVVIRADDPPTPYPRGQNKDRVWLYATQGAALLSATLDGSPTTVSLGVERGHPVFGSDVTLNPGQTVTMAYTLSEPTTAGAAVVDVQPLASPQQTQVAVPSCR